MRSVRIAALAAALVACPVIIFQNCTGKPGASDQKASSSQFAGGDGYDGKLFINVLAGGLCADGERVSSAVLIKPDSTAYVVRENCAATAPRAIPPAQVSYMPHNPDNLIFSQHTFDLDPSVSHDPRSTTYLCRGNETAAIYQALFGITVPPTFNDRWVDVIIKPVAAGHTARMRVGYYQQGSTSVMAAPPYDSGEFPVQLDTGIPIVFYGTDSSGAQLNIGLARNADGTLSGKATHILDPNNVDPYRQNNPDFNIYITCYPQ